MKVLQTTKITQDARVTLGNDVLNYLDAEVGDFVLIFRANKGHVYIEKVKPSEV